MLQFVKSQNTNSNAITTDVVLTSSLAQVYLEFTQSYDESITTGSIGSVLNNVVTGTPWVVFSLSGSGVPSPSGQYIVNIFDYINIVGTPYTWGNDPYLWSAEPSTWGDVNDKGDILITSERAYVSGSNEQTITQYVSPNENGTYITYNG